MTISRPARRTFLGLTVGGLIASWPGPGSLRADAPRLPFNSPRDEAIFAYLQRLEAFGFAGSVALSQGGDPVHSSAHGLADRERNHAWDANTRFDTGSVTKQFTAAGILALVADGHVALEHGIGRYLPDVPADKRPITLHQLLTHTSGIGDAFGGDYDRITRADFLAVVLNAPLVSAPGTTFAYSNAGFGLLAAIIEMVTGASADAYFSGRLFGPLGMHDTGYDVSRGIVARGYADGLPQTDVEQILGVDGQTWNLIGGGGLYSTIRDLRRWLDALSAGVVFPQHIRDTLWQAHVSVMPNYRGSGGDLYYGYGWYVWPAAPGGQQIWHLGGNGVLNCAIHCSSDIGSNVIYASNVSEFHDPAYPVPALERLLRGERLPLPPVLFRSPDAELGRLAGRYQDGNGAALILRRRGDRLRAFPEGQAAYSYIHRASWRTDPRLSHLNELTQATLQASRETRFADLLDVFPLTDELDDIQTLESTFWARRETSFGAFRRLSILGSRFRGSGATVETIASVAFDRGTALRAYIWADDDRLIDIYPVNRTPNLDVFLSEDGDLVWFDAAAARELRIAIGRDAAQPYLMVRDGEGSPVRLDRVS